jgi:hypothetical protein
MFFDAPKSWSASQPDESTLKLVEPAQRAMPAPLSAKKTPPAPRASIAASSAPSDATDARAAMEAFVSGFASAIPVPLKRIDDGDVVFKDGGAGVFVTIAFEVTAGRGALQRHLFRIDGGVLTQITGTVADWQRAKLDREVYPIMISYRRAG